MLGYTRQALLDAWGEPEVQVTTAPPLEAVEPDGFQIPLGEREFRARSYVRRMEPAVSGQGGHQRLWSAALAVVRGFVVTGDLGCRVLEEEYNHLCDPPWPETDLARKVSQAASYGKVPWGYLLEDGGTRDQIVDVNKMVSPPSAKGILDRTDLVHRMTEELKRRIELGFSPAPGPIKDLNGLLGGGCPAGAVSLLGAPPGQGKSSLALGWAKHVAELGRPAVYCSLEMQELDLFARLTSIVTGKNWLDLRMGMHREDLLRVVEQSTAIPLYVTTREQMQQRGALEVIADELRKQYNKAPFVVIDYLQLMIPPGDEDRFEAMGRISSEVRDVAQRSGSPILCITAVNRQSYNILDSRSHRPDMSMALQAAKLSGCLEYDAEAIMGLQLLEEPDKAGDLYGWVCVAKNRSGGGRGNIPVGYDGKSGNFRDAFEEDIIRSVAQAEDKEEVSEEQIMNKIILAVEKGGKRRVEEIIKETGAARQRAKKVFDNLISIGSIRKNVLGEYERGNDGI